MICPSCSLEIQNADTVWFCPRCDHILNLSFLGDLGDSPADDNNTVDASESFDGSPDAMILGDLETGEGDSTAVLSGVRRASDGRVAPILVYASGNTSRIVQPHAVLELGAREVTAPNTPIENFVLSCVDGKRTIRQIQRASGFAIHEITGAVLSLLDKGVVLIRVDAIPADDEFAEEVHTERTRAPLPRGLSSRPKIFSDEKTDPPKADDDEVTSDEIAALGDRNPDTAGFEPLTSLDADAFDEVADWERDEVSSNLPAALLDKVHDKLKSKIEPKPSFDLANDLSLEPQRPSPKIEPKVEPKIEPKAEVKPPPLPPKQVVPPPLPPKDPVPLALSSEYLLELATPASIPASARAPIGVFEPPPMEIRGPAPANKVSESPAPNQPASPERIKRAVSLRAPISERSRSDADKKPTSTPFSTPIVSSVAPPAAPPITTRGIDPNSDRAYRAKKLFDQAMKDRDDGDFMSAQMNVKIAMTFDPSNPDYKHALDDLSKVIQTEGARRGPAKRSQATELADQATNAETGGDIDKAILLLERSLKQSKDAATYNRLGVILAMRKKDFSRGREMIEKALEMSPNNETYQHNLSKILARAAEVDLVRGSKRGGDSGGGKKGLLGLFGKKK